MQANVDGGMRRVGHIGALVEAHRGIPFTQQEGRQAARLELLPQAQREREGHVLFRQLVAERGAAFVASVAGVDHHEILNRAWTGRRRRRSRRDRRSWTDGRRPGCGLGGGSLRVRRGLRRRRDRDGAALVAETGE